MRGIEPMGDYVGAVANVIARDLKTYAKANPQRAREIVFARAEILEQPKNIEIEYTDDFPESHHGEYFEVGVPDCDLNTYDFIARVCMPEGHYEVFAYVEGCVTEYYRYDRNEDGELDRYLDDYDVQIDEVKVWVSYADD